MLGKLLKYEFKATGRKFFPLYIAMLFVSLLINFGIQFPQMELMLTFSAIALFGLFVALIVVTIMTIVRRFKNNLLSDEGYLMFTLPVSTGKLILSKLITAVVWIIVTGIIAILSATIVFANREFIDTVIKAFNELPKFFWYMQKEYITWAILGIICFFTQLIYFVLLIYTSLSVSQIAVFNKSRGFVSFAAFIILYTTVNFTILSLIRNVFGEMQFTNTESVTALLVLAIITNLILGGIMFSGTYYLLKNHLNIE